MLTPKTKVNQSIKSPVVRVILPDGSMGGDLALREALSAAQSYDMDLVEVSPSAKPPVCKIINYSKWQYARAKSIKHSNSAVVKDIKFKVGIGANDFKVKCKHIEEIISKKGQVRVSAIMQGREVSHPELAEKLLNEVVLFLQATAKIDGVIKKSTKQYVVMLMPR